MINCFPVDHAGSPSIEKADRYFTAAGDGTYSRYSSLLSFCQPFNISAFFCFSFPRCLSFGSFDVQEETVGLNPYMGTKMFYQK